MKKFILSTLCAAFLFTSWISFWNIGGTLNIDTYLSSMSNKEKIAQMIMPAFRKDSKVEINNDNIKEILSANAYAGVILFAENTPDIESTMRFIDFLQDANKENTTRLLIAIDQEGWYVTRLWVWTTMPGNMALASTKDPKYTYDAAKVMAKELKLLGININFAPVVDINSNPANPVIGIRSFSDNPDVVLAHAKEYMKGLHSEWIIASLKHFPWHWDSLTDTHTNLSIIDKSYDELKALELKPFQELIDDGVEMVMTAHTIYPQIESETYISKKDWNTYFVPATLSKEILTDMLRTEMWFSGIIISDALGMAAISEQFGLIDASVRAINAWVDILLMPFEYDHNKEELNEYIETLAAKVGTEIDEKTVNDAVRRVLALKEEKWLFENYDNTYLEENITAAKINVSSKESHNEEFEIAKKVITLIKNDNNVLPLNTEDKTVILYKYATHIEAVNNAISILKKDGYSINEDAILVYPMYDGSWAIALWNIKEQLSWADNVIILHSLYDSADLSTIDFDWINEIIDYAHENNCKVIAISTQLPYDVVKFNNADAILLTYLANWIRFNLDDYEQELPKYGPNVIASIYQLFAKNTSMEGVLPVDIYNIDADNTFTDEVVYKRGFWLSYSEIEEETPVVEKTEIEQAYEFSFENGITTKESIQDADMQSPLTRIAMAKMLSNYAINVLGKVPANMIVPNFSDITTELDDAYDWWVSLAYQLWIMGIWINKFRPYDEVTRAEFATALSRLLFWTQDWIDSYYSTHLAKLKEEWIITNDEPWLKEVRWYVMLMLMRSAKK